MKKITQDNQISINDSENVETEVSDRQRKKSDATSTSSHELPTSSMLQLNSSSVVGIDSINRNHTTTSSPEQSPKIGNKLEDMKLTSQVSYLSTQSIPHSPHSHSPTPSPISSIPNSREASVEKSLDTGSVVTNSVNHDNTSIGDNISHSSESCKSVEFGSLQKSPDSLSKQDLLKCRKKEKRKTAWYNLLSPTYKSRSDDFKRLFKDLPENERLIVDYSCAMQKDILMHGRLYVSENYICFYANIFRWESFVMMRCRDILSMTKEKTARVIPNAIQICTETEKYFFTSFAARDKTYLMLFRLWQNALMNQPLMPQELWEWVHYYYGEELGLTSDDDDYVSPDYMDFKEKGQPENSISIKENDEFCDKSNNAAQDEEVTKHDISNESLMGTGESCEVTECITENPSVDMEESLGKQKSSEYPTDLSDTTESEMDGLDAGEIHCTGHNHEGKEIMDSVFPIPVDQLFTLLFTGSKFYHDLLESRKTYDIMESLWQLCPDVGHKMRQVTYTLTLNHSMAKSAQTTETQRLLKQSKPGHMYIIDCDVVNTGIPYSDTFSVKSFYCLTRVSNRHSRLRVHGYVHYKKSVWGLVKSLIEKSAMQGLSDFCTDLETALHKEIERSSQQPVKKHPRRRKRMKVDATKTEAHADVPHKLQQQASIHKIASSISGLDIGMLSSTPDFVVRVILITLVVLVLLNVLLFYKLWSLEDQSIALSNSNAEWLDLPVDNQTPLKQQDFIKLLRQQDAIHRAETKRWQDALGEIIKLIHLIEDSLSDLKSSIDTYSSAATFKAFLSVDNNHNSESAVVDSEKESE
ncbi:GRAM domain-containing protein 1B-like isoform X1 [Centruroides sculpturatus]|uniref:GRAM domain-containing protein 1B-like isoform X1 n=2 Tax=Centruroides sculpturatus TaxID=218467 RepID=UPI000C6E9927|nr:GRAM domain-containing protein 1B-like isoform X1 [Centruroides sculpturatus]